VNGLGKKLFSCSGLTPDEDSGLPGSNLGGLILAISDGRASAHDIGKGVAHLPGVGNYGFKNLFFLLDGHDIIETYAEFPGDGNTHRLGSLHQQRRPENRLTRLHGLFAQIAVLTGSSG